MHVLGIESSCDETAVAILDSPATVLTNLLLSQVNVHSVYGGVVPEIASREHLKAIMPLYRLALREARISIEDLDLISVTQGPGLIGSLLVGLCFAKSLAYFSKVPIIGVNHVRAHVFTPFLSREPEFPFLSLVVSGGHTVLFDVRGYVDMETLGHTRDDAAGEAFDKVGKFLGLGYPGGVAIDEISKARDPEFVDFPRAFIRSDTLEFSFSGIKTAVINYVKKMGDEFVTEQLGNIAASFQESVVDVLVEKLILAAKFRKRERVALAGGVSANSRLREKVSIRCQQEGMELFLPDKEFCTDNALMVAYLGYQLFERGLESDRSLNAFSHIRY